MLVGGLLVHENRGLQITGESKYNNGVITKLASIFVVVEEKEEESLFSCKQQVGYGSIHIGGAR
jgi:hypothetical protein